MAADYRIAVYIYVCTYMAIFVDHINQYHTIRTFWTVTIWKTKKLNEV